jgi:predicted Zn-dependent protease
MAGAFLCLTLIGCAQNPVSGERDFVMLSESSELAIGRSNHPKIIAQYGRYSDEALQAYVQQVGDKLAEVSHRKDLIYRFTVLDSPVINAFALPGGYIYITRGLMAYLNSEAELAAVLGHEIGHVTARHGVRQQSAAQAANIGFTLGSILFPELRAAGAQDVFNILGGALLSGYGREHELESDALGAEYLARAGYDPSAMMDVIRVLKNQALFAEAEAKKQGKEAQSYHGLFASHPDNDTRLREVIASADQYRINIGKRNKEVYLQQIDGMVFGDSEKQGILAGRHFYHSDMNFSLSFPQDWQINNKPDSLQAVAQGGEATIEVVAADLNRKISPEQFIKQRLEIDRLLSGQSIQSHGLEGYTGLVEQNGRRFRVSVVYLANRAFVFFATSKTNSAFNQFDPAFLATAKSLHALTQDERKLAKEKIIRVVQVKATDNYQRWSQTSRITNSPLLQLKLINGDYPNGELQAGQFAKQVD